LQIYLNSLKINAMFKRYFFVIIFILSIIYACNEDENNENVITNDLDTTDLFETITKVYYSLPSPMEMASIVKKYNENFDAEILHKTSESINYTTADAQAINLGVYAADLAFVSLYEQKQYSLALFECIIKLADNLEILEGVNDTLITEIEKNIDNPDEIKNIIAEAFFKSDAFLKENNREKTATLIMIGTWVESFYLMCDIAVNTTDTAAIYTLIADQRLVLENIINAIKSQEINDTIVNSVVDIQNDLNDCVTIEKTEVLDPYTDSLRIKTIVIYNYSSKKIEKIYEKIRIIRKNFISLH